MNYFILIALLALFAPVAHADEENVGEGELLSRYWLEDPFTLGATIGFPNHLFSVSQVGGSSNLENNVDYSPPQSTDFTLLAAYGPFQFLVKLPMPQSADSKSTYGKSSYNDVTIEFGRQRFASSLYYQSFSGFYTDLNGNTGNFSRISTGSDANKKDPNEFPASGANGPGPSKPQDILKRPDISSQHYGVIAWYAIPLKGENAQAFQISLHTLLDKPEPGFNLDLITSLFYDRVGIHSRTPFVPEKNAKAFGHGARLKGVDLYSGGIGTGLATSYVFGNSGFFIDNLLLYGGGAQRQSAQYTDDTRRDTAYVDNINFRFGVNFVKNFQQAGFHFWVNTLGSRVEEVRINSSNMALELNYAHTI